MMHSKKAKFIFLLCSIQILLFHYIFANLTFSNKTTSFILKTPSSKIRLNPSTVYGSKDYSIVNKVSGLGLGDYNLKQYGYNQENTITATNAGNSLEYVDRNIPENSIVHITENILIDGYGGAINLGENSQLFIDDNVTLTLRNVSVFSSKNGVGNPSIKLASHRSKLALDNATLNLANDFYFDRGQLFAYNDVNICGTNAFVFHSTVPSYITSGATLKFNPGTTFEFRPSTTGTPGLLAKDLLIMKDSTSRLYLDGCSLKTTMTGFRLTKGELIFDNKVTISSAAQLQLKSTESCDYKNFGTSASSVNWSPDGRYLTVGGNNGSTDLVIYSFNGSTLTQITSKDFGTYASSVNWSPDGRYLAVGGQNGTTDLVIYSFDGSNLTQITSKNWETSVSSVNWSPDGRYLAVGGWNIPTNLEIYSFDESNLTQITSKDFGDSAETVNWSPDGKYLAVGGNNGTADLVIYSFDGSNLTQIASKDFGTAYSVNWSPDGRYLAVGGNNGTADLVIYGLNYGPETQTQAISNSIVFGNSTLGSNYDLNVTVLAEANVFVDGTVNCDNIN